MFRTSLRRDVEKMLKDTASGQASRAQNSCADPSIMDEVPHS